MEIIAQFEHLLTNSILVLKLILEGLAAGIVGLGLVVTVWKALWRWHSLRPSPIVALRITFGGWLVLALEFQLAADIVSTTIAPSFQELAMLAVIAIIRTLLNYFLEKDIENARKLEQGQAE